MTPGIRIGDRVIGPGRPAYVIAEMSANHGQQFDSAVAILRAAKAAGADAVKTQTYTADTLTINCDNPCFRVGEGTLWAGRTLYDLYLEAYTPWDWQPKLKEVALGLGLDFFSTAYDPTAVDFLESLEVPAYKIASFEAIDLPLLRRVARTGKPIILSTGMASLEEIEEAVGTVRGAGGRDLALLKCTSAYPAPPEEMNLRGIPDLATRVGVPVGLSDHTLGSVVPAAAVALGACIVEKHITLSRAAPTPDSAFSLEPHEFKVMVDAIRTVEKALGVASYGAAGEERKSLAFRRSLFVVQDVKAGGVFTEANVRSIRPSHGLHPRYLPDVLGRRATAEIERGTPLVWELVEGGHGRADR